MVNVSLGERAPVHLTEPLLKDRSSVSAVRESQRRPTVDFVGTVCDESEFTTANGFDGGVSVASPSGVFRCRARFAKSSTTNCTRLTSLPENCPSITESVSSFLSPAVSNRRASHRSPRARTHPPVYHSTGNEKYVYHRESPS